MVKKWFKPRGKSMVLLEEKEINELVEKGSKQKSSAKTHKKKVIAHDD